MEVDIGDAAAAADVVADDLLGVSLLLLLELVECFLFGLLLFIAAGGLSPRSVLASEFADEAEFDEAAGTVVVVKLTRSCSEALI